MTSILKVLPQKQLSLHGLRKRQSNPIKCEKGRTQIISKDNQKSTVGKRKKGHEGLIAGEGRVKCIQLYEYAMFCYAVCLPSTPLNIHYYFFMLK